VESGAASLGAVAALRRRPARRGRGQAPARARSAEQGRRSAWHSTSAEAPSSQPTARRAGAVWPSARAHSARPPAVLGVGHHGGSARPSGGGSARQAPWWSHGRAGKEPRRQRAPGARPGSHRAQATRGSGMAGAVEPLDGGWMAMACGCWATTMATGSFMLPGGALSDATRGRLSWRQPKNLPGRALA
jgi:hypothetical protein